MFKHIKFYLLFAALYFLITFEPLSTVMTGKPFMALVLGLIVCLLLIAVVFTIKFQRRKKQKIKTDDDEKHLFL